MLASLSPKKLPQKHRGKIRSITVEVKHQSIEKREQDASVAELALTYK